MKTDLLGSWSLSGQVNTPRRSATTGTVLLRTDAFTEVTIDAELRTARVGAGTR
ncbi:hypothetical protein [Pseudonocardia abyssalis]|uniref:Lipocalin-like domain-containing protein n=1 Tax=Pseudonocardia abyssalis TaxID=2792008 RepID=A0ABS6ULZ4_9PSEU|nr:hypothetical protein [Pseudonocardia abyssalis]MBW0115712.1 hypothetical protein [Pseudonocardia abyssalis]MBW0133270.1 hypothetical protein [Pseudonocardia abyssalis]